MWLIDPEFKEKLDLAEQSGMTFSVEKQAQFEARFSNSDGNVNTDEILSIAGGEAVIDVKGPITDIPNIMAMFFGGGNTTYGQIAQAIDVAEQSDDVDKITLSIDSPGGTFAGYTKGVDAIRAAEKPITALIGGVTASAAYGLASQTDEIVASSKFSRLGSIGVMISIPVDEHSVKLRSTKAPRKNPDPQTAQGKESITDELDSLHDLFVESIAEGRHTSIDKVNENFGQGSTLLAEQALERGMIDKISGGDGLKTPKVLGMIDKINLKDGNMDLITLQNEHGTVYAQAIEAGVAKERDRVVAHLTMGENSGDSKTAFTAIKAGEEMTATLQATYMAAGMNKRDVESHVADSAAASAGDNAAASGDDEGEENSVVALVERQLGLN
jgi:ClpP class serine protease